MNFLTEKAAIIKAGKYELYILPVENFDMSKPIPVSFRATEGTTDSPTAATLTPVMRIASSYSLPTSNNNDNNNTTPSPPPSSTTTTATVDSKSKVNHAIHIARQIHPSFLKSNAQQHAEWIFGAFAELIDNAVDAKAKSLSIEYDAQRKSIIFADDGVGMTRQELKRMLSFGHKQEKK